MLSHKRINVALIALILVGGTAAWIAGCSVTIDDGGVSTSFTIGNKTVTMKLGLAGIFDLIQGIPIIHIADASGFLGGTPTDRPTTGTVRLRASDVTLRSSTTGKGAVTAQATSGIAQLRWAIDAPGAVDPCTTGIDLGTFEINVDPNGVINIVDEELSLTLAAVSLFLENNVSMCLQMEADFGGVIEISGFDVIFGPSDTANDGLIGTFQLSNLGLTNIHILAPGEEAGDTNRLTPGLVQNSRFENLSINDLLTFRAVRDGVLLDTVTCPRVNQGDFFAIVQWDGFTLTCFQPITSPSDQGCCLPDGTCEDITPEACTSRSGRPAGENRLCRDTECLGACCIPGACVLTTGRCGGCEVVTLDICDRAYGGNFIGLDVACEPWPCPTFDVDLDSSQACCLPPTDATGGECEDLPFDVCVEFNGDPQSFGTMCADLPCPQACCFDNGTCLDLDPATCEGEGGTPGGEGTECDFLECLGACCETNGCCELRSADECDGRGGDYKGFAIDCTANSCSAGFACYSVVNIPPPGIRFMTIQPGCSLDSGVLLSGFLDGGSSPTEVAALADDVMPGVTWPTREEAARACCALMTDFEDDGGSLRATLNGVPYAIEQIFIDECGPTGACCHADGDCTEASQEDCTALSSSVNIGPTTFSGLGTSCSTADCTPAAPTKWVLAETRVSTGTFSNDINVTTGRFAGTVLTYTETANSITMVNRDVDNGFENYNVTVVCTFPTPPTELIPGETVVLDVSFTHSGTWQAFNPGVQFQYWRDTFAIDPSIAYQYYPWNPNSADFGMDKSTTFNLTVPSVTVGGEIDLVAFLWNCSECNVHWIYRPG